MLGDRPLSVQERLKIHPLEKKVIDFYEWKTNKKFIFNELKILKKLIRVATPAQIIKVIADMHDKYPQNFTYFGYIEQPVCNLFRNRRGGIKRG